MPASISIVFPMYNEEAYIHRAIRAAGAALAEITPDHEIIIVDDASTDRTGALADALAGADPRIKVVHNERNRKLGGSVRAGYAAATKDLVLYTDADLPFDLQELGRAVRLLEYQEADVLAAYRFDRTSEGLVRTLYSFCYNLMIRVLFGLAVKDCRAQPVRAQVSVPSFSKADFIGSIATICRRSLQTAAALHVTAGAITGPCRR